MTIDWDKLHPYNGNKDKAFEELCCQIFRTEHGHEGEYRRIGMSGTAQKGVEAIILKSDGTETGIQAKWFYPGGISQSGRKQQVEKSLTKAKERKNLTKLIVCMPIILNEGDKTGWTWWKDLKAKLHLPYEIEPWDSDQLHNFLISPKHVGRRLYWFGELEFYPEWFERHINAQIKKVGDKYVPPDLYVPGKSDGRISTVLGDEVFRNEIAELHTSAITAKNQVTDIFSKIQRDFHSQISLFCSDLNSIYNIFYDSSSTYINEVEKLSAFLESFDFASAAAFKFTDLFANNIPPDNLFHNKINKAIYDIDNGDNDTAHQELRGHLYITT